MKKTFLIFILTLAMANTIAANVFNPAGFASPSVLEIMSDEEEYDIASAIVTRADVPLAFLNDETHPWTIIDNTVKNGNCGIGNSTSTLTMTYQSEYKTELFFDWRCNNSSSHTLSLYIDDVQKGSTTNSSFNTFHLYLEPGEHVIVFKDVINSNSTTTNNYSYIKNLLVKESSPLENAVLTENSMPLTFTNNSTTPWTIEDGYIEHTNRGRSYSGATFSTTFTVNETSKLSFSRRVTGDRYNYEERHNLFTYINGIQVAKDWDNPNFANFVIALEPGTYTVEWKDTVYNYTDWYYSDVKDIELISNWKTVNLTTAGTLGYEVLSMPDFNVLNDVEFLKVVGPLNVNDWTDIKNMNNLVALDLSEAIISEIPNNAFDGKSILNSVILPEGIRSIGKYAFRGTHIRRINIPSTVTTIGLYAFHATPIQYVTFASNSQIQTIDNWAFYNCSRLQSFDFAEESPLQSIGFRAFYGCSSLKEFIMPNTVKTVGIEAFRGCSSMQTLWFSDAMTYIDRLTCYDCTALKELHLPQNLVTIYYESFYNTTSLRHIDFPSTLNDIQYSAFYNCGVDSVRLPIQLQNLSNLAFAYCNNLKYIELPSYLNSNSYNYYPYYYDDGESFYSRGTYTAYNGYRNNFDNCPNIEKVVMRAATPPSINADPFSNARSKNAITLVVPSFSVVNYKLDTYWYQFGNIVEGDDVDYWKVTSPLMLTNNRRMQGTPDVDLYYGGQLTVGGNAPMEMGQFNMFINESNPGRLLNTCEAMSADAVTTNFSVNANTWYFFTPLHDVALSDITVSNDASYVFRYYDSQNRATNGTGASWKNVDTEKLMAGQGYIFHCNTACVITMPTDAIGQAQLFRTGDVTHSLTAYEATTSANRSWNYVGNPYPTYYDIYYMDFTAPITVWSGNTYKAYSIADDNYVLRPMQSFFVQKPDAVDAIVFHKEGRQLTSTIERATARSFTHERSRKLFNLQIEGNGFDDETRIVVNEESSSAYELNYDAAKFMSFDSDVPQIYTVDNEGNSYAINERPLADGQIKLAYFVGKEGLYTIHAKRADGEILLYDKQENKTVNLAKESYTFYTDATSMANTNRFTLHLNVNGGEATGINVVDETKTSGQKPVYDLQGRQVVSPRKGIYIKNGHKVVK